MQAQNSSFIKKVYFQEDIFLLNQVHSPGSFPLGFAKGIVLLIVRIKAHLFLSSSGQSTDVSNKTNESA